MGKRLVLDADDPDPGKVDAKGTDSRSGDAVGPVRLR
jgi:hypothetical protein